MRTSSHLLLLAAQKVPMAIIPKWIGDLQLVQEALVQQLMQCPRRPQEAQE